MSKRGSAEAVLQAMADQGWAARLVPDRRRHDLWSELKGRIDAGELNGAFVEERMGIFEEALAHVPGWTRSILLVAIPDPAMRIRFEWQGHEVTVTVPPTFLHAEKRGEPRVRAVLEESVAPQPVRAEPAPIPKKLLATRTGLSRFGRNSITYIEGLGSYFRLCALNTEIPCNEDRWHEPRVLESCESCGACVRACPAGAIDPDRFLVRAERCITFWHEKSADVPYPDHVDSSWSDQFVGCMRCQQVCPHNRGALRIEETGPAFTEQETTTFLEGVTSEQLSDETIAKLRAHDILDWPEVLPRNLRSALENAS